MPTKGTGGSAGFDLYSNGHYFLMPGAQTVIDTGVVLILPEDHYGKIEARSSVAVQRELMIEGGVIDQDYTGPIKIVIRNMSLVRCQPVRRGDKIAQVIIHKIPKMSCQLRHEIPTTERGASGFGSTGN